MSMHRLRSSLVLQLLLGTCGAALVTGTQACDSPCVDAWSSRTPYAVDDLPDGSPVRASASEPDRYNYWIVGDNGLVAIVDSVGATVLPRPVTTHLHALVLTTQFVVLVGAGGTLVTGLLDGSEFITSDLGTTADLWHVADVTPYSNPTLIAVGDGLMFLRDPLAGTWTAISPAEGEWGQLRAVGTDGDGGLIAVGLGGVAWTTSHPAGPWQRLDLNTTADLTTLDTAAGLIGGSQSTLLAYKSGFGWYPLAHEFTGDVVDIKPGTILTSDGELFSYDYDGLARTPSGTVDPGLRVLVPLGYDEELLVLGEPGRAVRLENACPSYAGGGLCEGRPFIVDELARTAAPEPRADWCAEALPPSTASPELRDALATAWTDAALAEHASIASFARAVLELLSLGAPPDLIDATQAALADEVEHARLCFAEARRHRDQPLGPGPLAQDAAVLARVGDPIAITLAVFDEGCVGEGVSAAIAGLAAEACRDEPTAALLRRICADESRHAALAWKTLRWLLDRFGDRVATPLRARLATLTVPPVPHTPHPDLRAHGRLAPRECATIHRAVLRRVVRPLADTLLSQPAHLHAEEQRA